MAHSLIKRKSKIHGKGIFTIKNIGKGVIFYKVSLNSIFNKPKSKCAFIGKNRWVSDKKVLNFINHSCSSNSILDISNRPKLIAKRNIKSGEEITVDYNKTEKNGTKVPCKCKSKNCRKYFLRIE
jgi:hypothetical protein